MTAMATDPPVSEAQRRAMFAAAAGHSTLGIPKKVGEEFVGKDATARGAGIMFVAPDGKTLFLRRSNTSGDHVGEWALPGGTVEGDETEEDAAVREAFEETGGIPHGPRRLMHRAVSDEGVDFSTFAQPVPDCFVPALDDEHDEHVWAYPDEAPEPTHPGVAAMLARFFEEEAAEPEHQAQDAPSFLEYAKKHLGNKYIIARPTDKTKERYPDYNFITPSEHEAVKARYRKEYPEAAKKYFGQDSFALDRASVRTKDENGYLHVARTHISKANVCGYLGREINDVMAEDPKWEPLDPDRIYQLLRDPEELKKAAPTFNNVPLLNIHVSATAEVFPQDAVIGSTGTDAVFADPYLDNSLVLWKDDEGIDDVESKRKKELSSAYRYRADMTPGKFQGVPYDGVMRDLRGNHVALVEEGRAGPDVVVGDAAIPHMKEMFMTTKPVVLSRKAAMAQGVLAYYLRPRLASDAKINLAAALAGVTGANFKDHKSDLCTAIQNVCKDKLAKDANINDLPKVMDSIEEMPVPEQDAAGMVTEPNAAGHLERQPTIDNNTTMDDPVAAVETYLKGKLPEKEIAKICAMLRGNAGDAPPPFKEEPKISAQDAEKEKEEHVDKEAMDAAIKKVAKDTETATIARLNAIRDAEEAVRPYVGKLAVACDSAVKVYQTALTAMGVPEIDKVNDIVALRAVLASKPVPGARKQDENSLALDASVINSYETAFPGAARIGNMG